MINNNKQIITMAIAYTFAGIGATDTTVAVTYTNDA